MHMKSMRGVAAAAVAIVLLGPAGAAAANKEHQQLMAEIRMLQEQQQQLQQMLGGLADTLKTVTAKLDDEASVSRKAFADQKLLIDGIGDGVRILREKADDTNVRLSTISQEIEVMQQAIASQPVAAAPAVPGGEPAQPTPAGGLTPPAAAPPTTTTPPPNISPQRMYDQAYADYAAGQWELAISGFDTFIKMFPRSPQADDAQMNIGNSLYSAGRFKEAAAAYQKVMADYPNGDTVPEAYYKMGLTFDRLGQADLARKAFETVIEKFPASSSAVLAKQRLNTIKR
jgi:tol-pal system protein YbgF